MVRKPNPRDGRGTLAEITAAGRAVMRRATADLMKAEFGMGGYSDGQLEDMFGLLRGLRVTAGDFKDSSGRRAHPRSATGSRSCRRRG